MDDMFKAARHAADQATEPGIPAVIKRRIHAAISGAPITDQPATQLHATPVRLQRRTSYRGMRLAVAVGACAVVVIVAGAGVFASHMVTPNPPVIGMPAGVPTAAVSANATASAPSTPGSDTTPTDCPPLGICIQPSTGATPTPDATPSAPPTPTAPAPGPSWTTARLTALLPTATDLPSGYSVYEDGSLGFDGKFVSLPKVTQNGACVEGYPEDGIVFVLSKGPNNTVRTFPEADRLYTLPSGDNLSVGFWSDPDGSLYQAINDVVAYCSAAPRTDAHYTATNGSPSTWSVLTPQATGGLAGPMLDGLTYVAATNVNGDPATENYLAFGRVNGITMIGHITALATPNTDVYNIAYEKIQAAH